MSQLNLGDSLILNSDIVVNGGEVKTGATFNGKPVYAKAISFKTADSTEGSTTTPLGAPNRDELWYVKVWVKDIYGSYIPACYSTGADTTYLRYYISTNGIVVMHKGSTMQNCNGYCVFCYTKTTD